MKRTALKRKTRLKSRAPLKRTPMQKAQKPCRKVQKDCRFRSEAYLAFVRTLPCCVCGATTGVAAHHIIGMYQLSGTGLTAPDSFAMPACDPIYGHVRDCHQQIHADKALRGRQPEFLRRTIRKGLKEFTGEVSEQLLHALAFVEAKSEPAPFKRCPHNDCGWCYAPADVENNAVHGQCREPRACPALIEATEVGR